MYILDFEYDGERLSDFGFIVCKFDESGGVGRLSGGSKITFNRVSRNRGRKQTLLSTQFDETISTTISICKNPDIFEQPEMELTTYEIRDIMRWLNRHEFLCFRPIYSEDWCGTNFTLNASFNVEKITVAEKVYGLELTMFTDSPYAYGDEEKMCFDISPSSPYSIKDKNDEVGISYPKLKIICGESGKLKLCNELTGCICTIDNCVNNEVITIDNENKIISSSVSEHDIYNDFNYDFFSIGNSYKSRQNKITSTLPCSVEMSYKPIVKLSM